MPSQPRKVAWIYCYTFEKPKPGKSNVRTRIRRVKSCLMPMNCVELKDQIEDAARTADFRYGIREVFWLEFGEPKTENRMRRLPMMFFKVDNSSGHKVKIISANFSGADPAMRAMKRDWFYSDAFTYERTPQVVGKIPDITSKFSESGTIHKQYAVKPVKQYATRPPWKEYSNLVAVKQYARVMALRSATKDELEWPTY